MCHFTHTKLLVGVNNPAVFHKYYFFATFSMLRNIDKSLTTRSVVILCYVVRICAAWLLRLKCRVLYDCLINCCWNQTQGLGESLARNILHALHRNMVRGVFMDRTL